MGRNVWAPAALAVGAALAAGGTASAQDSTTVRLGKVSLTAGGAGGVTMTLGGQGTVRQAVEEDNEATRWRGGWHGYRGGYGWGGYRGYHGYYGHRGGWGGYYGGYGYRYGGWGGYHRPYYGGYYSYGYSPYYGGWCGISSCDGLNVATPAVNLSLALRPADPVEPTLPSPAPPAPGNGTFRYDGGPADPVPPAAAAPATRPAPGRAGELQISFPPKPAKAAYAYKAYGEK